MRQMKIGKGLKRLNRRARRGLKVISNVGQKAGDAAVLAGALSGQAELVAAGEGVQLISSLANQASKILKNV